MHQYHMRRGITKTQIEKQFEEFGLKHRTINTRHWDWKRVLVYLEEDGPILGRARFDRGIYYDMVWYQSVTNPKSKLQHLEYRWLFYRKTGYHASEKLYNEAKIKSAIRAKEEYNMAVKRWEEKCIWAKNTPRPNGKPRKMPKRPENIGKDRYILDCMMEMDEALR